MKKQFLVITALLSSSLFAAGGEGVMATVRQYGSMGGITPRLNQNPELANAQKTVRSIAIPTAACALIEMSSMQMDPSQMINEAAQGIISISKLINTTNFIFGNLSPQEQQYVRFIENSIEIQVNAMLSQMTQVGNAMQSQTKQLATQTKYLADLLNYELVSLSKIDPTTANQAFQNLQNSIKKALASLPKTRISLNPIRKALRELALTSQTQLPTNALQTLVTIEKGLNELAAEAKTQLTTLQSSLNTMMDKNNS